MQSTEQHANDYMTTLSVWTAPVIRTPLHHELDHQFRLAANGVESTVVQGAKGLGKTFGIRESQRRYEEAEEQREMADPTGEPRARTLWLTASDATGKKTAMIDLHGVMIGRAGTRLRQTFTSAELITVCAQEAQFRNVRVIIVDEAQKIDAPNLDQLRQVLDVARDLGHPLGILLVGTAPLRAVVASTGELGQRYSGFVEVRPLSLKDYETHVPTLHPHLPLVRDEIGVAAWRVLVNEMHRVTGGSIRRLVAILANANTFAMHMRRPLDLDLLHHAMDKLAPEV